MPTETNIIKEVPINQVKINPNNPRIIRDEKFKSLVQSIKDFPEMLKIRPIVVNKDMVVLGGNMRLKACKEAGFKNVWIISAADLSPEKQREFIIKDNVSGGEWDWNLIVNEWPEVQEWGVDLPDAFEMPVVFEETKKTTSEKDSDSTRNVITCPSCGVVFDAD